MSAMWTQTYRFRDLGATPDHLIITAWGRRFTVVPSEKARAAAPNATSDVVIDVIGPSAPQSVAPAQPDQGVHVDVPHDESDEVTEVGEGRNEVIELVYESDDDITVVNREIASAAAESATGVRHGA